MSPRESQAERLERERRELAAHPDATSPEVYRDRVVRKRPQIRAELEASIRDSVKRRVAAMPD